MNSLRSTRVARAMATMLVLGAVSGTAQASAENRSSIGWGACPPSLSGPYPELTCATVPVPLDYAQPAGAKVNLLVSRRAAGDPAKRKGVLFINPGGPGSAASDRPGRMSKPNAQGATRLPKEVLDSYDLIGMDPRGVGLSEPLSCADPSFLQGPVPDPDNPANRTAIWDRWQSYARGCAEREGQRLPHMGTRNVAKDMNAVLLAMNEGQLNYLGYSYGTYLGVVFAELFPAKVGRMILDSSMNPVPERMFYEASKAQTPAVQRRMRDWHAWVAKYDDVFHLGTTEQETRAAWLAALADFRAAPHGPVGADELLGAVSGIVRNDENLEMLTKAFADWTLRRDDRALVTLATPPATVARERSVAGFTSVMCEDSVWPDDRAVYERDARKLAPASEFAWYNTSNLLACANWPGGHDKRVLPTGRGRLPILMFNSVHDPATPIEGAVALRERLPNAILVTELNRGKHGLYGTTVPEQNPHIQRIGTEYLMTGARPGRDAFVPGLPLPVPTAGPTPARSLAVADPFAVE